MRFIYIHFTLTTPHCKALIFVWEIEVPPLPLSSSDKCAAESHDNSPEKESAHVFLAQEKLGQENCEDSAEFEECCDIAYQPDSDCSKSEERHPLWKARASRAEWLPS